MYLRFYKYNSVSDSFLSPFDSYCLLDGMGWRRIVPVLLYTYLSHSKLLPFRGTSPWSQGINPSLPGTRLAFWTRVLGQYSRSASKHDKQTQSTTLFTHALTLSTEGIRYYEEKTRRIWNRTLDFPTLRATVGPLHHRDAAVFA